MVSVPKLGQDGLAARLEVSNSEATVLVWSISHGPVERVHTAYSKESTPPASMCRWFRVVIEVVRWRLA